MANTERAHHALQLAFGVHALPKATRGYVIISASDGAALYPLNKGIALGVFTQPCLPAHSPPAALKRQGKRKSKFTPKKWPGSNIALPGWTDVTKINTSVFVAQKNKQRALVTAVANRRQTSGAVQFLRALQTKLKLSSHALIVARPGNSQWICHLVK
tara:strand:- start:247 stop:720 length:474 start_codon:yes stop_codon:yes gene_type:complete